MKHNFGMALTLILLGVTSRLLPHPPNFAPIAAVAIFSGMYLKQWWGFTIPLITMIGSDIIIGFYSWPIMASVYTGFLISFIVGRWITLIAKNKLRRTISGTVLSSILFFVLTNWAVWAFGSMYPHTLGGLTASYTMAIPFFRNSLLGDLFFVGILVGTMEAISNVITQTVPPLHTPHRRHRS